MIFRKLLDAIRGADSSEPDSSPEARVGDGQPDELSAPSETAEEDITSFEAEGLQAEAVEALAEAFHEMGGILEVRTDAEAGSIYLDYPADLEADVHSTYAKVTTPPEDVATLEVSQGGYGYDGRLVGYAGALQQDPRIFDVQHQAQRSYPDDGDQGYTRGEDIEETHYVKFSFHKKYLEEFQENAAKAFEGDKFPVRVWVVEAED